MKALSLLHNSNTVLLSVVMTVFNGEAYLAEAIESVLSQTFRDFEFIIIDDGSTDGSSRILQEFASKDCRIRVLTQARLGIAEALNKGISQAAGVYIARMDADDVSLPDRFEKQLLWLETNPSLAVVGGQVRYFVNRGGSTLESRFPNTPRKLSRALRHFCCLVHPAVMFRRSVIMDLGGYRSCFTTAQDYDLWLRVDEKGQLVNISDVVLCYRIHDEQLSTSKLMNQAVSWLAARESARCRIRNDPDPLNDIDLISIETLRDMGLPNKVIYKELLRFVVRSALNAASRGGMREAEQMMEEILRHEAALTLPRLARAHRAWFNCYKSRAAGRQREFVESLVLACCLNPSYLASAVRVLIRRIAMPGTELTV